MRVQIIAPDKCIIVDGVAVHLDSLPAVYSNTWAIHYETDTGKGHAEWTNKHKNDKFDAPDQEFHDEYIAPALALHDAEMAKRAPTLDDERAIKLEAMERELGRRLSAAHPEIKSAEQAWILPLIFDTMGPANKIKYQTAKDLVVFFEDEVRPHIGAASKAALDEVLPEAAQPIKTLHPWPE